MSRPRLPSGELRKLAREVSREGWSYETLGSNHVKFSHPDTTLTVTASGTSRDNNYRRILVREMRRALAGGARDRHDEGGA